MGDARSAATATLVRLTRTAASASARWSENFTGSMRCISQRLRFLCHGCA